MINIKELAGFKLKKDAKLHRVVMRYHNLNKTGGNFGINLYPTSEPYVYGGNVKSYEFSGYHYLDGVIYSMHFSLLYGGIGEKIITKENYMDMTYAQLLAILNKVIQGGAV